MSIDRQHFAQLTGEDREFAQELIGVFLEDSYARLDQIAQAVQNKDITTLRRAAHHLRGSSANVGVPAMQTIARNIELHDHSWEELDKLVRELHEVMAEVAKFAAELSLN
jgi:HPt (histidine-containing phosphotransfer) domain-containing protein